MYFGISLLLHLALLCSMIFSWNHYAILPEKKPSMYVPSYTYQQPSSSTSMPSLQQNQSVRQEKSTISTAAQIRHASTASTSSSTKVTEAIHLVGDKNTVPKPLIQLLGKALAAHLVYPKIALDFKIQGRAFVGFILHPDGTLSNISLVRSSHAGVLDDEAMAAVSAISPIKNVSTYLHQPEPMVVGIIFE